MSRICVKNLPPDITEARLVSHFSPHCPGITDTKIARTREGRSRHFAFLGFKDPSTGPKAVSHYHRTYLGATQLTVELATEIGDTRPSAKGAKPSAAGAGTTQGGAASASAAAGTGAAAAPGHSKGKGGKGGSGGGDDSENLMGLAQELGIGRLAAQAAVGVKDKALLAEFLATSRPRGAAPTWANDDAMGRGASSTLHPAGASQPPQGASTKSGSEELEGGVPGEASDEEYEDLPASKGGKKQQKQQQQQQEQEHEGREKERGKGKEKGKQQVLGEGSDLDFLKSKVVKHFSEEGGGGEDMDEDEEKEGEGEDGEGEHGQDQEDGQEEEGGGKAEGVSQLGDHGRLFVRNLPFTATEKEVEAYFAKFGRVAEAVLPRDSTGRGKGFGYVTFIIPSDALGAMKGSDGKNFQGRLLHVLPAKEGGGEGTGGGGGGGGRDDDPSSTSFKRTREEAKKAAAVSGVEEKGGVWNALFIRSDTVLAAASETLGVSKGEVMERDASNLAVRLALAETRVIADTKAWLEENGVSLGALEESVRERKGGGGGGEGGAPPTIPRSDTTLLVKNLPADTDAGLLRDMFSRHGGLTRFLLPPSKAIAIVEYGEARTARRAFAALAYARFQRAPLFLEWAPQALLSAHIPGAGASSSAAGSSAAASVPPPPAGGKAGKGSASAVIAAAAAATVAPSTTTTTTAAALPPPPPPPGSTTLFVKNLSFSTTEEGLRACLASCGPIRSVLIKKRRNPRYTAPTSTAPPKTYATRVEPEYLSQGYGFVEFVDATGAANALRDKGGVMLDDHSLDLRLSTQGGGREEGGGGASSSKPSSSSSASATASTSGGAGAAPPAPPQQQSTATPSAKLIVRNLAFEANRKDVMELFSPFGTLKSVRLPKKFDGKGRGFAFVEFLTHAEAKAAKEALGAVHLYGRHLVLEWENSKEGGEEGGGGSKKRKRGGEGEEKEGGGSAAAAAPPPPPAPAAKAGPSGGSKEKKVKEGGGGKGEKKAKVEKHSFD